MNQKIDTSKTVFSTLSVEIKSISHQIMFSECFKEIRLISMTSRGS